MSKESGMEGKQPGSYLDVNSQHQAFEARESWCAVEGRKEANWLRANRRHFKEHLQSSVFDDQTTKRHEATRCTWQVNLPTHLQKRHYREQCMSIIPIRYHQNLRILLLRIMSFILFQLTVSWTFRWSTSWVAALFYEHCLSTIFVFDQWPKSFLQQLIISFGRFFL